MAEEAQTNLFTPFFSTKPQGQYRAHPGSEVLSGHGFDCPEFAERHDAIHNRVLESPDAVSHQPRRRPRRPRSEPHLQHGSGDGARTCPQRRSVGDPGHRRIVCPGRPRRPHGSPRAIDGSAHAVLPREAARGSRAVRRGPHRPAASGAQRRRPCGSVPSHLHAHGPGPLHRRSGARGVSRSRSHLHALLHAGARDAARGSRQHRPAVHRRAGGRDREVAASSRRAVSEAGADWRRLLGRHRQRIGFPRHLPRHASPGIGACPTKGVRAECRQRPGPRSGPSLSGLSRAALFSKGSEAQATISTLRRCGRSRTTNARRRMPAMGLRLCRGFATLRIGALPTAMAAREPEGLSDRGRSPFAASWTT